MAPAAPDEFAQLPLARQRGEAFVALLENIPTTSLPRHGGTATSVMVVLDYDTLLADSTRPASPPPPPATGSPPAQARRLACQAGIIPVVLGGDSEILDVGRTRRLVTDAIRKALNLRDRGCTERRLHHARRILRSPPRRPLVPRRQDQPRQTASCSAPSTTTAPTTPPGRPATRRTAKHLVPPTDVRRLLLVHSATGTLVAGGSRPSRGRSATSPLGRHGDSGTVDLRHDLAQSADLLAQRLLPGGE